MGFSGASSKPHGCLYFLVLVADEWRTRGRMSSTWVSSDWPIAPPPLKAVGAVLRDRPCLLWEAPGEQAGWTPPSCPPTSCQTQEALPGMGPFPGSPSWESSRFSPSSVSGRRAQGSASFQAPPGHLSWQVSSWSLGSLLLAGPCPACGGGGGDVMNPWDLLLPLSYQQCCLPPVRVSFCECRAVSASRPLSAILSPSASYQPRIPETLRSCR